MRAEACQDERKEQLLRKKDKESLMLTEGSSWNYLII